MAVWIAVWLILALVTTAVVVIFGVAMAKHGLIVGRSAARMAEEVGAVTDEIGREAARASEHASNLSLEGPPRRRR
jgi:hypothetical protein